MSAPDRIQLSLLGQTLTIRTSVSAEYLRKLADYLEDRVGVIRSSGVRDPLVALTLAALDITDELFRSRDDSNREQAEVGDRLGALLDMLDRATPSTAKATDRSAEGTPVDPRAAERENPLDVRPGAG